MSKKISINPDFFKIAKKDRPKNEKKAKISSKNLKANDIKKKLIAKIKEHQKKEKDREDKEKEKEKDNFKSDFTETIQYLEEIKNKKQKERKNKTLKKRQKDVPSISLETESSTVPKVGVSPAPPYGCLKNGTKPTWREYNKTLKKRESIAINPEPVSEPIFNKPLIQLFDTNSGMDDFSARQKKLADLKKKLNPDKKTKKVKTRRIKRKITLGKEKNKVGVLIKSKKTRKRIKNEISVLKKKSIAEVKEYLRKHNLIKIGSSAPDYILRTTYENAYLSGKVLNKNPDILLHNWHKDS